MSQVQEDRQKYLGSSDMPAICGVESEKWDNLGDLYLAKRGELAPKEGEQLDRGTDMEESIIRMFERKTGLTVVRQLAFTRDIFRVNLDGACLDAKFPVLPVKDGMIQAG